MNKVSAVVLTKNSQGVLETCLQSLKWCDEILIIDDLSSDATVTIARKHGAKILTHKLNNNFAQQRNYALKNSKYEWLLFIDSDEVVSAELRDSVQKVLKNPSHAGYVVERKNVFYSKQLQFGEWGTANILRLGYQTAGKWKRSVHEYWDIADSGKLDGVLIHNSPLNIGDMINKIAYYSKLHALENAKEGKSANFIKVYCYPLGKFILNYVVKKGYKDGVHGFIMAVMMSFHSFLSWAYLWLLKR